jgi:anti-anti-sigma factor
MKYTLDKQDQYATITLHEENLNSLIAPNLKSEFVFLRNEGVQNLILDLKDVAYVDSSGLSAILTANRLWKDHGAFVICGVSAPSVQRLIKISRLDTILSVMPTHSEAVDYVLLDVIQRDLSGSEEE